MKAEYNDPADCAICRRGATGIGIKWKGSFRWLCDDCIDVKGFRNVSKREFNKYEETATLDAGNAGGELLDKWGQTDLAKLDEFQFPEFVRAIVNAFGDSIRAQVSGNAAPF